MIVQKPFNIVKISLQLKRLFRWRVLLILVALYFLGNLSALPLLRATDQPIEPVWFWGVATMISAIVLAISMLLANRTGLGAPLIEGLLQKEDLSGWLRSGSALTVLAVALGLPFSLLLNLNVNADSYPAGWQLFLASIKAGIVEELVYRFFTVSLFVWLGSLFRRDYHGYPTKGVYWSGILISGLFFGYAHVDARLGIPGVPTVALLGVMVLSTLLGVFFGWLYWQLGIEWAMFAHFAYDAVVSAVLIKVYHMNIILVWAVFLGIAILAVSFSLRALQQNGRFP